MIFGLLTNGSCLINYYEIPLGLMNMHAFMTFQQKASPLTVQRVLLPFGNLSILLWLMPEDFTCERETF